MYLKSDVGDVELISRKGYSGQGDWWDDVVGVGKGALDFYGEKRRAEGQAEALQAAMASQQQKSGPDWQKMMPLLIVGGLVLGGIMLLSRPRRRRSDQAA